MNSLRPYAQLVRLPALPTALADVCLGALATDALPARWVPFGLLLLASGCLYCAGMVFNDFFDLEQDRRERPSRPLPAGKVTPRAAARLGSALLAAGVLFGLLAGWAAGSALPAVLAALLAGAVLLYDARLKRTWAGPLGMGACRFLNVLLAVSVTGTGPGPLGVHLALVVGLYVVGLTWFARTEARTSSQSALAGAAVVLLAGLLLAVPLPEHAGPGRTSPLFLYLLVGLGFAVGLPAWQAIGSPTPARVQAAVRRALFCLIVLDAVLATALAGTAGLLILVLLAPSLYLARKRWLYAT